MVLVATGRPGRSCGAPPWPCENSESRSRWSDLKTADQLVKALDSLPWQPPSVFLMRRGGDGTYTLRLAEDVYPNQPNVRRYTVDLDADLFTGPHFTVKTIGPFVLAIRNNH